MSIYDSFLTLIKYKISQNILQLYFPSSKIIVTAFQFIIHTTTFFVLTPAKNNDIFFLLYFSINVFCILKNTVIIALF